MFGRPSLSLAQALVHDLMASEGFRDAFVEEYNSYDDPAMPLDFEDWGGVQWIAGRSARVLVNSPELYRRIRDRNFNAAHFGRLMAHALARGAGRVESTGYGAYRILEISTVPNVFGHYPTTSELGETVYPYIPGG